MLRTDRNDYLLATFGGSAALAALLQAPHFPPSLWQCLQDEQFLQALQGVLPVHVAARTWGATTREARQREAINNAFRISSSFRRLVGTRFGARTETPSAPNVCHGRHAGRCGITANACYPDLPPMSYQPLKRQCTRTRTDTVRPVNEPQSTRVSADATGRPLTVQQGKRGVRVRAVQNHWRVDDRWWTDSPVHRHYWELELITGEVVTVFLDEAAGEWFEQRYTPRASADPGSAPLTYPEHLDDEAPQPGLD